MNTGGGDNMGYEDLTSLALGASELTGICACVKSSIARQNTLS